MRTGSNWLYGFVCLLVAPALFAQSLASGNQNAAAPAPTLATGEVPRLIKLSGTLLDAQGRPQAGPVGVTFALYSQQSGGATLWLETQNVKPDENGNYTVLLGANSAHGVPAELFTSNEARWLGIQVGQQPERERILLVSVPYALKAGDAETLGGLPASAFVTAGLPNTANSANSAAATSSAAGKTQTTTGASAKTSATPQAVTPCSSVTSDAAATVNSISLFTTACNIESSVIMQASGNVGIGTATPAVAVDVLGNNAGLRLNGTGTHQITVTSTTTGVSGRLGQDANGFFFTSDTNGKSVRFLTNNGTLNEWMRITSAGNVGIHTQTPAATLDINGNLNLPNTASATVGVISLGGTPFLHNFGTRNTFIGSSAGNMTMDPVNAQQNTAVGAFALKSNTTGNSSAAFGFLALASNTAANGSAFGAFALASNTTGANNSAFGTSALTSNNTGNQNSAFGYTALFSNTTGSDNAAFGPFALYTNTTGASNAAFGSQTLRFNTMGQGNSAFGTVALKQNTTGSENAAFGLSALSSNTTGGFTTGNATFGNSAFGSFALTNNTTASGNSAFGAQALQRLNAANGNNSAFGAYALGNLTTGGGNIAMGQLAGANLFGAESNNIDIGNAGVTGESGVIRIGTVGTHVATFMAGISGVTSASGTAVFVNSNGQLGTVTSSRRFKDAIIDMAGESDLLMKLRPVAFYYKPELDPTHTRQYGLVAEEVAQVSPELVVFDKDGAPETVRYHFINAMLLNEVQKQQSTIARQQAEIQDLAARLAKLEALVALGPLGR